MKDKNPKDNISNENVAFLKILWRGLNDLTSRNIIEWKGQNLLDFVLMEVRDKLNNK